MKNRYPKACSICQGLVPAGEGILYQDSSGWSVIHSGACLQGQQDNGSIRVGYARAYTRKVFSLLNRSDVTLTEVEEAVRSLAALVRTGWTTIETCERILLNSKALEAMDRCSVEDILSQLTSEESHAA
jgi:hypothetical protein